MAKRRGESTASYKLRKRQQRRRVQPMGLLETPGEKLPLNQKASQISSLALGEIEKGGKGFGAANHFMTLLKTREMISKSGRPARGISDPRIELDLFQEFNLEINAWLREIRRPELQLNVDEIIALVMPEPKKREL